MSVEQTSKSRPPESAKSGVELDFTGVFKLQDLKGDPPPPPKKVPDDILIGAQELSKGNCFINMSRRRPARNDLMQAVSLGVDAYLSKPTRSKALMDAVTAALGG